jgi:Tfp pilus assembly protein PilX
MRLSSVKGEEGFTMVVVMLAMLVISILLVATVSTVNGDLRLNERDLDRKQAYEAAEAGIADYAYHLNSDTNYWSKCTTVPTPSAVNQVGSTANRRTVAGTTGTSYAIELLPATGKASCSIADPVGSMIEGSGNALGTFRIRSTGYSGSVSQSVVATFKRSSFLDYVYFTQLETSDPVTYGYTSAAALAGANSQCSKTYAEGRYDATIPGTTGDYCDYIVFSDGETINGPLHTNDFLMTCGVPTFGRTTADVIEISGPTATKPLGWDDRCGSSTPNFLGTRLAPAPVLTPPATNGSLSRTSGVLKYSGTTDITLSGSSMTVVNNGVTKTVALPTSKVIYVASNGACNGYSPFAADATIYPTQSSGCGTVYVSGNYSSQLTIAAENDIIIDGNLTRAANGLLGLIANNFVRVQHPFSTQTSKGSCGTGSNGTGTNPNIVINAAILSIDHSFIVDHYNCGADLGTITVNGAISQKYRGPVGIVGTSSPGYSKNYTYDDRLRYIAPPEFLDPIQSAWKVQRQTIDN